MIVSELIVAFDPMVGLKTELKCPVESDISTRKRLPAVISVSKVNGTLKLWPSQAVESIVPIVITGLRAGLKENEGTSIDGSRITSGSP